MTDGRAAEGGRRTMVHGIARVSSLSQAITRMWGNDTSIIRRTPIAGGDINEAYGLELTDGSCVFMKRNRTEARSFFEAEAAGLCAIAQTGTIRMPRILCLGTEEGEGGYSFLLLEYVMGGSSDSHYWETFAHQLADMHRAPTDGFVGEGRYGFCEDNYIGRTKQKNAARDSWVTFFRDCRLEPQFQRARQYFSTEEEKKAAWLLVHLDEYLTEPEHPSLLHGDLWSGNVMAGNDGKAWLIDPAVSVGHAEADIAMTELFGGFPKKFYAAYRESGLLQPGYERRRDLYNLYHLLNHLNLFGGAYLSSVKQILRKYVS